MPIGTHTISDKDRDSILGIQESHFFDVKRIEIGPAKLTRAVSAFANADGGEIYVGIDEDKNTKARTWRGFSDEEAANGHVQAIEALSPLGQDWDIEFLSCNSCPGLVLSITVRKSRAIIRASAGLPYVRKGAQSLPVETPEALARLQLDKGITSFETETLDADLDVITNSEQIIKFMLDVVPSAEPEPWLRKQQLIKNGKPAVAGVLLFSDEPQAILPKRCGVKIYRYKTKDATGTRETLAFDPTSIEGCLYDQIKVAVKKTVEIIEEISVLGTHGLEFTKYPVETLQEIITNAVLHRDYSIQSDVHVRIFDNRVEVESPGRLPGHITEDNILDEQLARNGTVVRLINKFPDPPNKDVGEGLNTAFDAMRKLRLKEPTIKQRENSVVVNIRHEPLASSEDVIMDYLDSHPSINNSKARELCYIGSENVMKRVFERLMKARLIERVPGLHGRAIAYRKVSNGQEARTFGTQQHSHAVGSNQAQPPRTLWSNLSSQDE